VDAGEPTDASRIEPHFPQNFAVDGFSAPHFAHCAPSGLPQFAQKLLLAGFSEPHFEQCIGLSPPGCHNIARIDDTAQGGFGCRIQRFSQGHRTRTAAGKSIPAAAANSFVKFA
jgi:hypothetical protein